MLVHSDGLEMIDRLKRGGWAIQNTVIRQNGLVSQLVFFRRLWFGILTGYNCGKANLRLSNFKLKNLGKQISLIIRNINR